MLRVHVILLTAFLAVPLRAADAPFLNINPSWSPDGRWLVFQSDRNGVNSQLYIIRPDGRDERRLTTNGANDTHPQWSPDGEWILFDSDRDGTWNLYVMRPDGSGERRLTRRGSAAGKAFARHPGWCPDGKRIVFDSDRDGDEEIYVMNADGTGQRRLTYSEGRDGHASCTPDGKAVFGSYRKDAPGMWFVALDGSEAHRLTDRGGAAKVSPDGRLIAFSARDGGKPDLFVMNRDGSGRRNLTNDPFTNYEHTWAPDSSRIAYYSDDSGKFELYVMNADGSGRRQLTDSGYQSSAPRWSPDGQQIVFASDRDGDWEIYAMSTDGSNPRRFTWSSGVDRRPSFTSDGARIIFESARDFATDEETDLYAISAEGREPVRIVGAPGSDGMAVPAPDGKSLAFLRRTAAGAWDVFLAGADGTNERRLVAGAADVTPAWSRDARSLLFVREGRLHRLDIATLTVTMIDAVPALTAAALSPDGSSLAFVSSRDGGHDLYHLDIATSAVMRLTNGIALKSQPDWSPDGERILFSGSTGTYEEVYVIDAGGGTPKALTRGNLGYR